MPGKEDGKISGKNVAARLSRYAAPVPRPIRLNILGLRLRSEDQNRRKNGQPPHSTTGVARMNSMPFLIVGARCRPSESPSIESNNTGKENAALTQKRMRMDSYSGSASTSAKTSMGSSAIPHFGQIPGPIWTISVYIGLV